MNELYLFASSDKLTCTTRLSFFTRPLPNLSVAIIFMISLQK